MVTGVENVKILYLSFFLVTSESIYSSHNQNESTVQVLA